MKQLCLQFEDPRGLPLFDETAPRDPAADAAEDALNQWPDGFPPAPSLTLSHPTPNPQPRTAEWRERRSARIREIQSRAADKAAGKAEA